MRALAPPLTRCRPHAVVLLRRRDPCSILSLISLTGAGVAVGSGVAMSASPDCYACASARSLRNI
jgi:hypothetical protein